MLTSSNCCLLQARTCNEGALRMQRPAVHVARTIMRKDMREAARASKFCRSERPRPKLHVSSFFWNMHLIATFSTVISSTWTSGEHGRTDAKWSARLARRQPCAQERPTRNKSGKRPLKARLLLRFQAPRTLSIALPLRPRSVSPACAARALNCSRFVRRTAIDRSQRRLEPIFCLQTLDSQLIEPGICMHDSYGFIAHPARTSDRASTLEERTSAAKCALKVFREILAPHLSMLSGITYRKQQRCPMDWKLRQHSKLSWKSNWNFCCSVQAKPHSSYHHTRSSADRHVSKHMSSDGAT